MKELCNKFRALRVPEYTLVRLFRHLRENSDAKKAEDLALGYMNKLVTEYIEKYVVGTENLKVFRNGKRIRKQDEPIIEVKGTDYGYPDYYTTNGMIQQKTEFTVKLKDFPALLPNRWVNFNLRPEIITNQADLKKLQITFGGLIKARAHAENYLREFCSIYNNDYTFLKGIIPGYITYGKLYDYNKEWFNILVEEVANISEAQRYGEGDFAEVEEGDKKDVKINVMKVQDIRDRIKDLKDILNE